MRKQARKRWRPKGRGEQDARYDEADKQQERSDEEQERKVRRDTRGSQGYGIVHTASDPFFCRGTLLDGWSFMQCGERRQSEGPRILSLFAAGGNLGAFPQMRRD
jgi:hypothetical protein